MRPHRRQATRLPRPWDSPGKNTGVGHHFLLQCWKVESESEVAQSCPTISNPVDCSLPGSSVHGIFQARVLEWGSITFSLSPRVCSNFLSSRHWEAPFPSGTLSFFHFSPSISHFLILSNTPGLSCVFSIPVLESNISLRSFGSHLLENFI